VVINLRAHVQRRTERHWRAPWCLLLQGTGTNKTRNIIRTFQNKKKESAIHLRGTTPKGNRRQILFPTSPSLPKPPSIHNRRRYTLVPIHCPWVPTIHHSGLLACWWDYNNYWLLELIAISTEKLVNNWIPTTWWAKPAISVEVGQGVMQSIILTRSHSWMAEEEGASIMLWGVRRMIKDQEQRRPYGKYPDGGITRKWTDSSLASTLASSHAQVQRLSYSFP
jgi:hypothetical protein